LNELVIDTSGAEIIEVMKLATNPNNFPIALYCTAGDDDDDDDDDVNFNL